MSPHIGCHDDHHRGLVSDCHETIENALNYASQQLTCQEAIATNQPRPFQLEWLTPFLAWLSTWSPVGQLPSFTPSPSCHVPQQEGVTYPIDLIGHALEKPSTADMSVDAGQLEPLDLSITSSASSSSTQPDPVDLDASLEETEAGVNVACSNELRSTEPTIVGNISPLLAARCNMQQAKRRATTVYKCSHCERGFSKAYNRTIHERTHTDERPFACQLCSRRFRRKDHLRDHCHTHLASKPFVCPICNRGFCQSRSLENHRRSNHPNEQHQAVVG